MHKSPPSIILSFKNNSSQIKLFHTQLEYWIRGESTVLEEGNIFLIEIESIVSGNLLSAICIVAKSRKLFFSTIKEFKKNKKHMKLLYFQEMQEYSY